LQLQWLYIPPCAHNDHIRQLFYIIIGNNKILYSILENYKTTTAGSLEKNNNTVPIVFGDLSVNRLSSSMCVSVCMIETNNEPWKTRRAYKYTSTRHLCCGGGPKYRTVTIYKYGLLYVYVHNWSAFVGRYYGGRKNVPNDYSTKSRWKRVWRALKSRASSAVSIIIICPKRFFTSIKADLSAKRHCSSHALCLYYNILRVMIIIYIRHIPIIPTHCARKPY